MCYLLISLGDHPIFHISRIRVKQLFMINQSIRLLKPEDEGITVPPNVSDCLSVDMSQHSRRLEFHVLISLGKSRPFTCLGNKFLKMILQIHKRREGMEK
jgi:hypothetical protein